MAIRNDQFDFDFIVIGSGFGGKLFPWPQAAMAAEQVDPKRPLKVALVLPGSVSDGTFNAAADKGVKQAQAKYPNVTVSVRENTGMAQIEAALFEYASNGYDVVIGHGFQFAEAAKKIHNQFPKTWFIINVDYAFGQSLREEGTKLIAANGAKLLGAPRTFGVRLETEF